VLLVLGGVLAVSGQERSEDYTLSTPASSKETTLVDRKGEVVHTWVGEYARESSARLLDDGTLLRCTRRVQLLGWDSNVLWDHEISFEEASLHVAAEPLANGNVLVIGWGSEALEFTVLTEIEPVLPDGGRMVWQWEASADTPPVQPVSPRWPPGDTRVPRDHPGIRWGKLKSEIRDKFPRAKQLSVRELAARDALPVLLDVREPAEYAVSHLVGARRARTERQALAALEGVPRDTEIVLYCSVGYRSSQLVQELAGAGYTNLRNLEGSIFEWANAGHPVVRGTTPVEEVHPYDKDWGRLLDRELWSDI